MNPSTIEWVMLTCMAFLLLLVFVQGHDIRRLDSMFDIQVRLNEAMCRDITKLEKDSKGKNWISPVVTDAEGLTPIDDSLLHAGKPKRYG